MQVIQRSTSIRELVPLLFVEDIAASAAFYQNKLGFQMTMKWEPDGKLSWCRLARDDSAVMLQQACEEDGPAAGRGRGVGFFFNCEDADAMHADFASRGLAVAPPVAAFYGMNQIFVKDPDGYELCFQSVIEGA
jgi:glyoxylase I family protein